MSLKNNVALILCLLVLSTSIFTLGQLVIFLSSHGPLKHQPYPVLQKYAQIDSIFYQVLTDVLLVCLFMLQHSLQNCQSVKNFLHVHNCSVFERLLFNSGSCITLQMLMQFWNPIPSFSIWEITTSNSASRWWFFVIIHGLAWLLIYSGCFIMDPSELLGAKQVLHSFQGLPDPMRLKSSGHCRFYSHMRHPSFTALTIILFFHPIMQLDRLVLASGLVLHMVFGMQVDDIDYAYSKRMLLRKERDLNFNE